MHASEKTKAIDRAIARCRCDLFAKGVPLVVTRPTSHPQRLIAWGIVMFLAVELSCTAMASTDGISAVTYDPGGGILQVVFRSGEIVTHTGVPEPLYKAFMAAPLDGDFYRQNIVDAYPRQKVEAIPADMDLGPIDVEYLASIDEPPPELLISCRDTLGKVFAAGASAKWEIGQLDKKAITWGDVNASEISSMAKNALMAADWASRQAGRRLDRSEFRKAHALVQDASHEIHRLRDYLRPLGPLGSSNTIRDRHQALHFIQIYGDWLETAESELLALRQSVERSVKSEATTLSTRE